MEVALQVNRRFDFAHVACSAYLVPGHDPAALLEGLGELGIEPLPRVYLLACGFLVRLDAPHPHAQKGWLRLGELAEGILAPIDAELTPALLGDELKGLTGGKGVVCLPEGFYAFDPSRPQALGELLTAGTLRRRNWQPFPKPEERAEHIKQFILDLPKDDAEELLNQGGQGIGEEEPGPDETGSGKSMLGKLEFATGKALGKLGGMLGSKGMQKAGGSLVSKGINNDPAKLKNLLGKQESALRDLLRRFREGKIDEALRRALPVTGEEGRGSRPSSSANLPFHNLMYSLGNILGGGGGTSPWFMEPDIYGALVAEYRKAAEQARSDGDYRRAAFIYGKLLGDYRTAANLLQQGGLHRDAAALYLQKLKDPMAAARAFENGGDVDDAVRLYRKIGQHVPAGDLLRRVGDEDAALDEYRTAGRLLANRGEFKQAGELLMAKAQQPDEALVFFKEGWRARPHPSAVPCAVHMAVVYADEQELDDLHGLSNEADRFFAPPGNEARAAQYYNMLATLAQRESMTEHRAELHDRALVGMAHKLRQNPKVNAPFDGKAWSNAFVSDVRFALQAETRKRPAPKGPIDNKLVSSVQIGSGTVVAVTFAFKASVLFVAFDDGAIHAFSPTGGVQEIRGAGAKVQAIETDPKGEFLAVVDSLLEGYDDAELSCFVRRKDGQYFRGRGNWTFEEGIELIAVGDIGKSKVVATIDPQFGVYDLRQGEALEEFSSFDGPHTRLCARLIRTNITSMLVISDRSAHWLGKVNKRQDGTKWQEAATHWRPLGLVQGAHVAVFECTPGNVELAGRNEHGSLYWSAIKAGTFGMRCESRVVSARGDYLCACITKPGKVAGVTSDGVNWYRKDGEGFVLQATTKLTAHDAVACYHAEDSDEVIVLSNSGRVSLVSLP